MYNGLPDIHENLMEMDKLIRSMPLEVYCDWTKAGKPGYRERNPDIIKTFMGDKHEDRGL